MHLASQETEMVLVNMVKLSFWPLFDSVGILIELATSHRKLIFFICNEGTINLLNEEMFFYPGPKVIIQYNELCFSSKLHYIDFF